MPGIDSEAICDGAASTAAVTRTARREKIGRYVNLRLVGVGLTFSHQRICKLSHFDSRYAGCVLLSFSCRDFPCAPSIGPNRTSSAGRTGSPDREAELLLWVKGRHVRHAAAGSRLRPVFLRERTRSPWRPPWPSRARAQKLPFPRCSVRHDRNALWA
jgi:hypothetical protein